jgi:hypothetical protein
MYHRCMAPRHFEVVVGARGVLQGTTAYGIVTVRYAVLPVQGRQSMCAAECVFARRFWLVGCWIGAGAVMDTLAR